MNRAAETIFRHLRSVAIERERRHASPRLARDVEAVKRFQHARFERTYADILALPRYSDAARFFLDDLYGPHDFGERDAQFERVVPGMVRLFSRAIVATVAELAELHALSESLDTLMASHVERTPLDGPSYVRAWQATGANEQRQRQVALLVNIGRALDRYTRNPLLRRSLTLLRRPARLAGIGALQQFLERGFDTFAAMRGADEFLSLIAQREAAFAQRMFAVEPATLANTDPGELL